MAVILKKKPAVQPTAPAPTSEPVLSDREKKHLIEAGIIPAEPVKKVITINKGPKQCEAPGRKYYAYSQGERVKIVNDLFSWMEWWKPGDTGTVVKYSNPVPENRGDGLKWGILIVKLDKPRVKGRDECYFHAWEVDRVAA